MRKSIVIVKMHIVLACTCFRYQNKQKRSATKSKMIFKKEERNLIPNKG